MLPCALNLLRLDIDPRQRRLRIRLSDHAQHGARAAADFQQPIAAGQRKFFVDERSPMVCLRDQPILLAEVVSVDIFRIWHHCNSLPTSGILSSPMNRNLIVGVIAMLSSMFGASCTRGAAVDFK